jgi:RHS repeat-associated protein
MGLRDYLKDTADQVTDSAGDLMDEVEDTVDTVGETAEELVDQGLVLVGESVEEAGDATADGLDYVGFEGTADRVNRITDSIADQLGAEVGELQLGETDDPRQLVHGDVGRINESASHLATLAAGLTEASASLRRISLSGWTGQSADAFHAVYDGHPEAWTVAADACSSGAKALGDYAHTVTWAQGKASDAIARWDEADQASAAAHAAYDAAVTKYNVDATAYHVNLLVGRDPGSTPLRPPAFSDPGAVIRDEAEQILTDARSQRDEAAARAESALRSATEGAPAEPDFTDRMAANVTDLYDAWQYQSAHFSAGLFKGTAGLVNFARAVSPSDLYNLRHPAEYLQGISDMTAGLVYAQNHPVAAVKSLVGDGWGTDPAEAAGRLAPDALLALVTDGAGSSVRLRGLLDDAAGLADDAAGLNRLSRHSDCVVSCGDPVDVATGAVFLDQVDLDLPGVLPLVVRRRHTSSWRFGQWFGRTWSCTFDERVEVYGDHVLAVLAEGVVLAFPHPTVDEPTQPVAGAPWLLERTDAGGYRLTDPATGQVRHYARVGADDPDVFLLVALTDPNGNRIMVARDEHGGPVELRHSGGYRVLVDHDGQRVTRLSVCRDDGSDPVEVSSYDYVDGHLAGVVNASGSALRFGYDWGRLASWADRNGTTYDYRYDEAGRCIDQGGSAGVMTTRFSYTDLGDGWRETAVSDSRGDVTRFVVDDRFLVVAVTDPLDGTTASGYDARNRLTSRVDPLGRTTRFAYEGDALVAVTRPDCSVERFTHVLTGGRLRPATVELPDGTLWRVEYDDRGNQVAVSDPTGATTRCDRDDLGRLVAVTDAIGGVRMVECDGAGLPVRVVEPNGVSVSLERDPFGRVVSVTDPLGAVTTMTWTASGQLASRTLADGSTESWRYDAEDNPVEHIDPAGRRTCTTYTHFDLLAAVTTPDGAVTRFDYDPETRLSRVTNAQGLVWSYEYDAAGRLMAETDFDGRMLRYEYDAVGQLVRRTNGAGEVVFFTYDALGRVSSRDVDGAVTRLVHDPLGRLLRATGPEVELVLQRDPVGRVAAETVNGRTLTSAYDPLGQRTSRETPSGLVTTWEYDGSGRAGAVTVAGHRIGIDRDLSGREVCRDLGGVAVLDQVWDDVGRLVGQTLVRGPVGGGRGGRANRLAGGDASHAPAVLQSRRYAYGPGGQLVGVDDRLSGARRFELDLTDRITGVRGIDWAEIYAYDPAGNLVSAGWPDASCDRERREFIGTRIVRSGRTRYVHDAQGRLVQKVVRRLSRKPETWSYAWDADDRLLSVRTPDGTVWRYLYDALGRRVAKRRLDERGAVVQEVLFTWDGMTLAEETASSGAVTSWTHDGLRPLAQVVTPGLSDAEVDARFYAIVTDLAGSPTELVDTSGELVWHARRSLWGAPGTLEPEPTPLRFPGQYADPETGLFYNVHRYYDPDTARYVSQDPLGLAPAPNPTAYVANPTTTVDPLGLAPCEPVVRWGGEFSYRHGGPMTAIEHINYRHAFDSGFTYVSRYAEGTSVADIRRYVEDALNHGIVSEDGSRIRHDIGQVIGTDREGYPVTGIQVYVSDGDVRTAFPVAMP